MTLIVTALGLLLVLFGAFVLGAVWRWYRDIWQPGRYRLPAGEVPVKYGDIIAQHYGCATLWQLDAVVKAGRKAQQMVPPTP